MEKRLLVAVDGSTYSNNTIHYLGTLFAPQEEVSLHLLSLIPCGTLPPEKEWLSEPELLNVLPPDAQRKMRLARTYMKNAIGKLERLGIKPERITTEIKLARLSMADEIIDAARKGLFDALIIGRRGITKLEELIIGSVSEAVFQKCHDIPVWIIDGRVDSRRFLLPVDGSLYSLMAADHLAHILQNSKHCEITLFHSSAMLASVRNTEPSDFYARWGRDWCDEHMSRPDSLYHAPKQLLLESGIPEERINWLHTSKGIEASRQIIRQALIDEYGTIVIGRRGEEARKGLFRGISDRVVLMADRVAIWIVG